jgi:hypothetical protein
VEAVEGEHSSFPQEVSAGKGKVEEAQRCLLKVGAGGQANVEKERQDPA